MIADHDRSGWFGASDTAFIVGSWKTRTWENWWLEKLGIRRDHFENRYTQAGTNWEHRILESLGVPDLRLDEQVILEDLRLRVNYDGTTDTCDYECKTYKLASGWRNPKKYAQQMQVQMFAKGFDQGKLVIYGLEEPDYDNYFRPVDPRRLKVEDVKPDPQWITLTYLPRLRILRDCLMEGRWPDV